MLRIFAIPIVILVVGCAGGGSSSSVTSIDKPNIPGNNEGTPPISPQTSREKPETIEKPKIITEMENLGFSVRLDAKDKDGSQAAQLIEAVKSDLLNHHELFSKIGFNDYFEYDPIKLELHLSHDFDSNRIEMRTILEMSEFGKALGNITIATPALYPHMAWPKLKAKIEPYKDKIKSRAKYIRHIETFNISDQYYPMTRLLAVNEEWDSSYLETALKEVDQSKFFLDQLPNIRLNINRGAMSLNYDQSYESLQLLTPSLNLLGQTMTKFEIESLGIEDSIGLNCKFHLSEARREVRIFAFTSENIKDNSCSVSELVKRIATDLEIEKELKLKISEEYMTSSSSINLGPSAEGLKIIESLKKILAERKDKFKEVRISDHFHSEEVCELKRDVLSITKHAFDLAATKACIQKLQ